VENWNVVVWNDEVNLAAYVAYVFRRVLGLSRDEATALMLDIHRGGRATVISGTREHSELNSFRLQSHGLRATLERV
jgi:ATP-dependent Clp protease adaptor protein ClpS